MKLWDHIKPFPECAKTGSKAGSEIREMMLDLGPEKFLEKVRDARIDVLKCRAAGHDIGFAKAPDLYARFPELQVMEDVAEASFLAVQCSGGLPPPL